MGKLWQPHFYQQDAVEFLIDNPQSGLFLDPGLGKTAISLTAINYLIRAKKIKAALVVAPLRVIYSVWPEEIKKWKNFSNLTCTILHGKTKKSLFDTAKHIYLINPEGLPWLVKALLASLKAGGQCPFNALWIDESTKFKNHETKTRFEPIKTMRPLFKRRHIMTGTPAPRGLLDLWAQLYLLDGGETLGKNFYKFRKKYFYTDDWNKHKWIPRPGSADKIHRAIAPSVLEISARGHLQLPAIIYNKILVTLPDKAMALYENMENDFFMELDGAQASAQAAVAASLKCHQIANGRVYEDVEKGAVVTATRDILDVHSAKLDALRDLVDELNGKPLLIAYHYKHDLAALKKLFGANVAHIGSGVSVNETKKTIEKWNLGELPILLGHPVSMAHGLNLQAGGNDVCWFSLTWNLEEYLQFNARVYRQGVKGSVRIHHIIAKNTIDLVMFSRLGEKEKVQKSLRDALREYRESLV